MNLLAVFLTCAQLVNPLVAAHPRLSNFGAIPCDAVGAAAATDLAIAHINGARREGRKYSLHRVHNVQEKEEQGENVYYLEFEVMETQCHVTSPTPLKSCETQSFPFTKVFGKCEIIIRISKSIQYVKDYLCSEYPVERSCPECLSTLPQSSREVDRAVNIALAKYNSESNNTNYFSLYNVSKTSFKSEPSEGLFVEFVIQETDCSKLDLTVVLSACAAKPHQYSLLGFCKASLKTAGFDEVIDVSCVIYATKGVTARGLSGQMEYDNPAPRLTLMAKRKRSVSSNKPRNPRNPRELSSSWAVSPLPLATADRNNPIVIKVSGLAVQKINTNRKEGYIYSLVSIRNAQTQSQGVGGTVYYLTLSVDETECHVLSRKDWKSCDPRMFHQSVKGECNATLHINNLERIVCLHDYNCSLTPVDPHKVAAICPDCPINLVDMRSKASINNADKALTKYNQDSNNIKYFNLLNVTKYSFQGVFFNAHYLEFTIVETMCSRKQIVNNLSKCKHLAPGVAQFGFCKASVKIINMEEGTTVTCELYKPEQYKDLNNPNLCRLQDTIEKSPKDRREATRDKVSHRIFS